MLIRTLFFLIVISSLLHADEFIPELPTIWEVERDDCVPFENFCAPVDEDRVIVDLREPLYEDGCLSTVLGGVIRAPGVRIQAEKITYTRNLEADPPVYTVCCEGNLLVDYGQWVLLGDCLFYDFLAQTGYLTNGKTAYPPWYIGGEKILLLADGKISVCDATLSTSEGETKDVLVQSSQICLTRDKTLSAKDIKVRVGKIPIFYFPRFSLDLNTIGESPFAIKFGWGGFLGSHISALYRFLTWRELKTTARLDWFFGHGPGGGIQTEYNPRGSPTEIYTQNYYAHDIALDDPRERDRFRFAGTFYDIRYGITIDGTYDWVSDAEMAADYNTKDFQLKTAGRTSLDLRKQTPNWIANLFTTVKVNKFQSVNQELPSFLVTMHPIEIPKTGIIVENTFQAAYLDYNFSDDVVDAHSFHSARVATHPRLYRSFPLGALTTTTEVGLIAIGYSNSPGGNSAGQMIGEFAVSLDTALSKQGECWKHTVEPYIHYSFLTAPKVPNDRHFIFTIEDGYHRLNLLRLGVSNSLFKKSCFCLDRPLWVDLWTNVFIGASTIPEIIPKGYYELEWYPTSRLFVGVEGAWNFQHNLLDFNNLRIEWTVSDHLAFNMEYRHRSRFDWRKADFYNFILEVSRTQEELLVSPLSDRRDTFLFQTFCRLSPNWMSKFELRRGWDRLLIDGYFEYQFELSTIVYQHWQLGFLYEKRKDDPRFSFSLKLMPGPPSRRKCR